MRIAAKLVDPGDIVVHGQGLVAISATRRIFKLAYPLVLWYWRRMIIKTNP